MTVLSRLSEDALAILRAFVRANLRTAGSSLSVESLRAEWRRPSGGFEVGLADLEAAGLVARSEDGERRVALARDGELLFGRYHWSCHDG